MRPGKNDSLTHRSLRITIKSYQQLTWDRIPWLEIETPGKYNQAIPTYQPGFLCPYLCYGWMTDKKWNTHGAYLTHSSLIKPHIFDSESDMKFLASSLSLSSSH